MVRVKAPIHAPRTGQPAPRSAASHTTTSSTGGGMNPMIIAALLNGGFGLAGGLLGGEEEPDKLTGYADRDALMNQIMQMLGGEYRRLNAGRADTTPYLRSTYRPDAQGNRPGPTGRRTPGPAGIPPVSPYEGTPTNLFHDQPADGYLAGPPKLASGATRSPAQNLEWASTQSGMDPGAAGGVMEGLFAQLDKVNPRAGAKIRAKMNAPSTQTKNRWS